MERKNLEVYSEASNHGVVCMPGRSFPGSFVPGDALASLCRSARRVHRLAVRTGSEELADEAEMSADDLGDRLRRYEGVLAGHGIPLLYPRRP